MKKPLNIVLSAILIFTLYSIVNPGKHVHAAGKIVSEVYTDKTRYNPGETGKIYVELQNDTGTAFSGTINLYFTHLGYQAGTPQSKSVSLLAGAKATLTYIWEPPATDFKGYHVEVLAMNSSGSVIDIGGTAVDVSSDWAKFPRYGFVSRFGNDVDTAALTSTMRKYLVNSVQFYDWHWKHHLPYSPNAIWKDIANRDNYRDTVNGFITNQHNYGMAAMNYNLYGSAYDDYLTDGSGVKLEWGAFKHGDGNYTLADQDQHGPLPSSWATSKLYMFDPANTGLQTHIFNEEKKAHANFAFDGFHIDSLGSRGNLWDWNRNPIILKNSFAGYANNAKSTLETKTAFNAVATYGLDELAKNSTVDFIYSELWDDDFSDEYNDINNISERIRSKTNKGIVYAAYMNYAKSSGTFNDHSVRLANAAIFASGGSHIELGDGEGMLSSEYFPNRKLTMSSSLKAAMKDDYAFLTAYQNLLRDGVKRGMNQVELSGISSSTIGSAGAVWKMFKSKPGYDIVHLVNLAKNDSTLWRDTDGNYPAPNEYTNIPVKMYYKGAIKSGGKLWYASPDYDHGKAFELRYSAGSDKTGKYITFTLPRLHYWDMIWLEKDTDVTDNPLSSGLYSNDFDWYFQGTHPSDWYARAGQWGIVKPSGSTKELQNYAGGILEYAPGFSTGNYTVKARVFTASTQGNGAILARVQNDGGFYQLEVKSGTTWALYKNDGNNNWTELAKGNYTYRSNTYHNLKLTVNGNKLTVYINGSKKGTFTDSNNPFLTGSIGLRSESGTVRFDDIKVVQ